MRPLSALLAAAAISLGAAAAHAGAAASTSPKACKLLSAAVRDAGGVWPLRLTRQAFTPSAGGAWRCELTSPPPKGSVSSALVLALMFFVSPSASVAHTNVALLQHKGTALAGSGADEAFAQEQHQGGSTSTRVTWRKSRYWGWLSLQGPRLLGDREDARNLLKRFVSRLPAS